MNFITFKLSRVSVYVRKRMSRVLLYSRFDGLNKLGWQILKWIELNKLRLQFIYWMKLRPCTPIIVYSMAKVGSTSVKKSLESCGVKPSFKVHSILRNPIAVQIWESRMKKFKQNWWLSLYYWSIKLYPMITKKGARAKFITVVREPISRNVSHFFEDLNFNRIVYGSNALGSSSEELIKLFFEWTSHGVPLRWFDNQLKSVLGIDIFQYPFPKEKGYLSIKKGSFELLILKLEVNDSVKERAIGEFLNVSDFKLTRSNVAQKKGYAAAYTDFIKKLELPESYVEIMCNSEYMRHFYTDFEIEAIRTKWQNRIGESELPGSVHEDLLRASMRVAEEHNAHL